MAPLRIYGTLAIVLAWIPFAPGTCQEIKDAQIWQKADIEFNITPTYSVSAGNEFRFTDNCSQFSYYYYTLGNSFRLFKKFKLSADYLFVGKEKKTEQFSHRNQFNIYLTYREKIHHVILYDRVLCEGQFVDYNTSELGHHLQDRYIRDKLTLRYKINKHYYPYIEDEIYYKLDRNKDENEGFNRNRFYTGLLYEMKHQFKLDAFFLYEKNFNVTPLYSSFVYGIGISRSFF